MSIGDYSTNDSNTNFQEFKFYESDKRQKGPFIPIGDGNFPPAGNNYPLEFNPPKSNSEYSPNFNYPGGTFNPPGMPKSPPPNYIPHKNETGVQKMSVGIEGSVQPYAVSAGSIRFCLYKYTYIWEISGRSYWAYLLNINRRTVSGFRWFRNTWVYFGVDLRRVDSFVCYRTKPEDNWESIRPNDTSLSDSSKEYSLNGSRDLYNKTLASVDIPQNKENFIDNFDYANFGSELSSDKAQNISYRITLQVSYPSNYDEDLKNKINEFADKSSNDVLNAISSTRNSSVDSAPLEIYNSLLELIPNALQTFSDSFYSKINSLNSSFKNNKDITFCIRNEKICNNFKPYFYNDSLF